MESLQTIAMSPAHSLPLIPLLLGLSGVAWAETPAPSLPDAEAPACPESSCTDPRWDAPRIAGAYDFLPGEHRPFQVVVDPISWNLGAWNIGPVVALTAPSFLDDELQLDAWQLQLGSWWMPGDTVRWRIGAEVGLCLRTFHQDGSEMLRDWLPAVGGRAGMSRIVFQRWRVEAGLRLVGELPPTDVRWQGELLDLPIWRAQVLLGIHLPSPGRSERGQ